MRTIPSRRVRTVRSIDWTLRPLRLDEQSTNLSHLSALPWEGVFHTKVLRLLTAPILFLVVVSYNSSVSTLSPHISSHEMSGLNSRVLVRLRVPGFCVVGMMRCIRDRERNWCSRSNTRLTPKHLTLIIVESFISSSACVSSNQNAFTRPLTDKIMSLARSLCLELSSTKRGKISFSLLSNHVRTSLHVASTDASKLNRYTLKSES